MVTVPGTQTVIEETPAAIAGISISDVDAGGGNLTTRLQVTAGVLNVSLAGGATFSAGSNGTNDLTVLGSVADVNATLASLQYTGNPNLVGVGADTLLVTVDDGGNTGSGGALFDVDTVQIDIGAVNDAPVNTVPGTLMVNEETPTAIPGISVADVDVGGGIVTTRLQVTQGVLAVTTSGGATISAGANGTNDLTVQGIVADLNATLASLQYTGNLDVAGVAADMLTITTDDGGNTGAGGVLVDVDTVQIDIAPINDDPVNLGSIPSDIAVVEDTPSSVDLSLISLSDVDAGGGNLTVTLTTSGGGNLTAASSGGVSVGGSGTSVLTLTGTLASLNAFLDVPSNITYLHGVPNTIGDDADTLQVALSDNGNTGAGGGGSISLGTANIDIADLNDAPVIVSDGAGASASVVVNEGSSPVTTVVATDVDLPPNTLTYTVSGGADAGLFAIDGTSGELRFIATPDFEVPSDSDVDGDYRVEVTVDDGLGGTDTQLITVTVADINDAPEAVGDSYTVFVDETLVVSAPGLLANDLDQDRDTLTVSLVSGPAVGTLTVNPNGAFEFVPPPSWWGTATFSYRVSDGSLTSSAATVTITVLPGGSVPSAPAPDTPGSVDPITPDDGGDIGEDAPTRETTPGGSDGSQQESVRVAYRSGESRQLIADLLNRDETLVSDSSVQELSLYEVARRSRAEVIQSAAPWRANQGSLVDVGFFWDQLDAVSEDLERQTSFSNLIAGSAVVATGAFSAGVVMWSLRASQIIAMLSSSLPAWAVVDPIPVLDQGAMFQAKRRSIRKGETLEDVVAGAREVRVQPLNEEMNPVAGPIDGSALDISETGAGLRLKEDPATPFVRIQFNSPLPDGRREVVARVCRSLQEDDYFDVGTDFVA